MNIDCYVQGRADSRVVGDQLGCLIKRKEKIIFCACAQFGWKIVNGWKGLCHQPLEFSTSIERNFLSNTIRMGDRLFTSNKTCAFEVFSSVDCRAIHCPIKQLKRDSHPEPNSYAEALCHCGKKGKQLNSVFGCTHWSNQLNAMYRGVSRNPRSTDVHKHTWLHNNNSKLSFLHPVLLPLFPAQNLHAAAAFATSCLLCDRTGTGTVSVVLKLGTGQKV